MSRFEADPPKDCAEEELERLRLQVAELEPRQMKHLFDPFFTTRIEDGGTGLGLSVAHGIVAEHSGKIWVESTPDVGSRFVIELPLAGAASPT